VVEPEVEVDVVAEVVVVDDPEAVLVPPPPEPEPPPELDDAQDSLTLATPTLTGSEIEERGVPGATLTVKDNF